MLLNFITLTRLISLNIVKISEYRKCLIHLFRVHAGVVLLHPVLHLVEVISPPGHPIFAHLPLFGQLLEPLGVTAFISGIFLLEGLVFGPQLGQFPKHPVPLAI